MQSRSRRSTHAVGVGGSRSTTTRRVLPDQWLPYRTTDFAGVLAQPLPEKVRVSNYAYWFTRNHHRLPDREDMVGHLEAVAERGKRGDEDAGTEAVA